MPKQSLVSILKRSAQWAVMGFFFEKFAKELSIIISHCHLRTKVFEGTSRDVNLEPVLVRTETVGEATKVSFIKDKELMLKQSLVSRSKVICTAGCYWLTVGLICSAVT